jgi:hypothetical protein
VRSKKIGAPPKRAPKPGERFQLGVRVTPEMKMRIEAAAEASGRSISQEAELRIEQSFDRQDLLTDVMMATTGSKTAAAILMLIARVMVDSGLTHKAIAKPGMSADWAADDDHRDIALLAAICLLALLRPKRANNDPQLPAHTRGTAEELIELLNSRTAAHWRAETRDLIGSVRQLLGPDILRQLPNMPFLWGEAYQVVGDFLLDAAEEEAARIREDGENE